MDRKVTFLIPAYNEEESLPELYQQVMDNVQACISEGLMSDYEFLFINDGSTDGTAKAMEKLHEQDDHVRYIFFRKNFGKSVALETGFRNVTGDVVITMDADLQDDPCELANFLKKLDEVYRPERLDDLKNYLIVCAALDHLSSLDRECYEIYTEMQNAMSGASGARWPVVALMRKTLPNLWRKLV